MHASMQEMVLIAKVVSTRIVNFVRYKLVIYQNGKVISKRVLFKNPFLNPFFILSGENYYSQYHNLKWFH